MGNKVDLVNLATMYVYVDGLKSLLVMEGAWGQAGSFTRQTHGVVPSLSSEPAKPALLSRDCDIRGARRYVDYGGCLGALLK